MAKTGQSMQNSWVKKTVQKNEKTRKEEKRVISESTLDKIKNP